jgi:hypothetical protein
MAFVVACGADPHAPRAATEPGTRPRVDVRTDDAWRFTRVDDGLPRSGQWRDGFALADLDGDGHVDLVHGAPRKGRPVPVVFRGDGLGHWRRWETIGLPTLPYDYGDVRVGDVTGDGIPDLTLAVHLHGLFVLAGAPDGRFRDATRGLAREADAPTVTARAVAVVDWDRDGVLDVVTVGEGLSGGGRLRPAAGLHVFLNEGGARWRALDAAGEGPPAAALAVGDVDGDGWPDALTGSSQIGRQDVLYTGGPRGRIERRTLASVPERSLVQGVALADVDHDGLDDLVTATLTRDATGWYGRIDVLGRPADPASRPRTLAVLDGRTGFDALAVGDVDRDGAIDVVAVTGDGSVVAFRGDGRGGFVRERGLEPAFPGCAGRHVAIAPLGDDGRAAVVVSHADERPSCPSGGGIAAWRLG